MLGGEHEGGLKGGGAEEDLVKRIEVTQEALGGSARVADNDFDLTRNFHIRAWVAIETVSQAMCTVNHAHRLSLSKYSGDRELNLTA